jgi:hypothetical protein
MPAIADASGMSGQFNLWTQPAAGRPARQRTDFTGHAVREVALEGNSDMIALGLADGTVVLP